MSSIFQQSQGGGGGGSSTPAYNAGSGNAPTAVNVTNSSTQILAYNADRKWAAITNVGARTMWFSFGQTAVAGSGLMMGPNGIFVVDTNTFSTQAINGITDAGSTVIAVQEVQ